MSTPTQEYGWVIIDTPEKKKQFAPKRLDDEVWYGGHWARIFVEGEFPNDSAIYRRRIDHGEAQPQWPKPTWGVPPDGNYLRYAEGLGAWVADTSSPGMNRSERWWMPQPPKPPAPPSPAQKAWDGKGDFESFRKGFEAGRKAEK